MEESPAWGVMPHLPGVVHSSDTIPHRRLDLSMSSLMAIWGPHLFCLPSLANISPSDSLGHRGLSQFPPRTHLWLGVLHTEASSQTLQSPGILLFQRNRPQPAGGRQVMPAPRSHFPLLCSFELSGHLKRHSVPCAQSTFSPSRTFSKGTNPFPVLQTTG